MKMPPASSRSISTTRRHGIRALAEGIATLLAGAALWLPAPASAVTAGLPATFWKGTTDHSWTGQNWASDATGTPTTAIPTAADDVTFSISSAAEAHRRTLDRNFTIHSLTLSDPAGLAIDSGNGSPYSLTISGSAGTGINVQSGAGILIIAAEVTLAGASDTITVNNSSGVYSAGVFVRAPLAGSNGLKKEGTGTLSLEATNTYTGGTTVNAGTLAITSNGNSSNPQQNFLVIVTGGGVPPIATLGSGTANVNGGIVGGGNGGTLEFREEAGAGSGLFLANGGTASGAAGGIVNFRDYAVAGSGTFIANGGTVAGARGGSVNFHDYSFADTGSFTANAGAVGAGGGAINFDGIAWAGTGTFVANGASAAGAEGGSINFHDYAQAGNIAKPTPPPDSLILDSRADMYNGSGTFFANGGTASGAAGGSVRFYDHSTGGAAALRANGGTNGGAGGLIQFSGAATGTAGPVTVNGNGRLDISGSTNGGVSVGSLSGDGNVFLGARNLTAGGNNAETSFSGKIQDGGAAGGTGGSFTKTGAGALTLSGTNTYTGPTTVQGGTLLAGSTQAFGINSPVMVNAQGILDLGGFSNSIGSLSGNGSVTNRGTFATAINTQTTLTIGGLNTDAEFSGSIFAPSLSIVKIGSGTQILSGPNGHGGGTIIKDGTLAVGNETALGFGDLTMTGGTLRTEGGPRLLQLGVPFVISFRPYLLGYDGGNILFTGGTYVATVGGTSPGVTHDQIKTSGAANIAGATLALVQLNGYRLALGDQVVLISADGGVAGGSANGTPLPAAKVTGLAAFSSSPLLVPAVNLYPTSVVLELVQGSFAALAGTLAFTPNQSAVAAALDSLGQIGSKAIAVKEFSYLDSLAPGAIAANLDMLSPEALTSIFQLSKSLANIQSANIQRRLEDIRLEFGAIIPVNSVSVSIGDGAHDPKGVCGMPPARGSEERWGMFMSGSGEFTHVGGTANAAGFNLDSGGVTAGVDYRFTDHFAAGISIGYMNTTASLANGGKVDVDGGRVGAYATYFNRGLHVDAAVSGGPNSYATRRTTPNNTAATGSPEGTEVNLLLATGYDWKFKGLTIGPIASFQYTNAQLNGFTERGGFAPLNIFARSTDSARSALGFHATFDAKVGRAIVRPEVRAAWQHEFGDTGYSLTSGFATLGGNPFTVAGPTTGRDSLLVGTGLSIRWNERFAIYAYYDGELLRSNYSSNSVSVGFRYQF